MEVAALYPTMRLVVLVRDPNDVLGSLLSRQWFDVSPATQEVYLWPFREHRTVKIPACISDELHEWWVSQSTTDAERAATYLLTQWGACDGAQGCSVVDYDRLVSDPPAQTKDVFTRLGLEASPKTSEIVARITPRATRYPDIMGALPKELRIRLLETAEAMQRLAALDT